MKGAGYALESIVAIATVFIFIFGSMNIPANQEWSQFREQTSADDLTYTLQKTGYINHALKNGETGSIQTAFSTITERDIEVSGLVSNLPINENRVAFYVLSSERYIQNLEPVNGGCEGDLEEITTRSEEPVLRSTGNALQPSKNNVTYVADLDPYNSGAGTGDGITNYDSIWVDNGTACQFSDSEGPYYTEEIFKWGNEYYDFKNVDSSSNTMRLYNATQPVRFREVLEKDVNDVETFTSIDTVNFTRLNNLEYNTAVFRENQSLDDIENNRVIVEDFLQTGSIFILANLNESFMGTDSFLSDAGFQYADVSYESPYSAGETTGRFPTDSSAAQTTETYFIGLDGDNSGLSIKPAAKIISDTESTFESGRAILKSDVNYNFSEWRAASTSMSPVDNSVVSGEPDSSCYSETNRALTQDAFNFPEETYSVISAELGTTTSYCNNNNDRAIKIDIDDDNEYTDPGEGPYLNGERIEIDSRSYGINIIPYDSTPGVGCDTEGGCVEFVFTGDRNVELIPRRTSFPELNGQKVALTGYEENYEEDDMKALISTIYWLRGDRVRFTGAEDPEGISTNTFSAVQNETYMPYELNLRWSR